MRWVCGIALSLLVACATSQPPGDAGVDVDLTVGHCDPTQLFAMCSAQCHMPICIVASATCSGTQWICDCNKTGPCLMHD
jgi:hypothetical protein